MGTIVKKVHKLYPALYNRRFYNYAGEHKEAILMRSACMLIRSLWSRFCHRDYLYSWTEDPACHIKKPLQKALVTWIGHATFLLNIAGMHILTDPVFGNLRGFFRRIAPPGISVQDLPPIDLILISHNHYDHMDESSLRAVCKRFPDVTILVPQGNKAWFATRGFSNVQEYSWWEATHFVNGEDGVTCTFLPAYHWSQRGVFDRNMTLWGSWMIQSKASCIYFAGDTAYGPHFRNIAHFFPHIDVALMPIAPAWPRAWMARSHILPDQAVDAFIELGARHFIPMHWGTFWFGIDRPLQAVREVQQAWKQRQDQVLDKSLHTLKFGQSCSLDEQARVVSLHGNPIPMVTPYEQEY